MAADAEQSLLIVGQREPLLEALRQALEERYRIDVEIATSGTAAQAAVAAAPDLVLLVGDATGDGGSDVLQRFAQLPMASVVPVVLLADEPHLDERLQALRFGAAAVIPRSASVDAIARQLVELMQDIPERSGQAFGELGETTLEEFLQLLNRELRSGILSVRSPNAGENETVRLVLGEGQNVQKLIEEFVERVGSVVSQAETLEYEFDERPGGSLQLVGGDEPRDAGANIEGLRVLVADSDPVRADAIAQDLRARGATAVIADLQGRRLDQLRNTDPSVLVIGEQELRGPGYELIRRMRDDPRLGWTFLLVVAWDEIWAEAAPRPTTDRLVSRLAALAEPERTLRERAVDGERFDTRLEVLGPARLLRTLASAPVSLRITVRHRRGNITVDVADGLIVGAESKLVAREPQQGPSALAQLLVMGSGRVRVEPVEHPAHTNLMSTPDVALDMAEAESSTRARPSRPGGRAPKDVQHVASARTGLTDRPPEPAPTNAQPNRAGDENADHESAAYAASAADGREQDRPPTEGKARTHTRTLPGGTAVDGAKAGQRAGRKPDIPAPRAQVPAPPPLPAAKASASGSASAQRAGRLGPSQPQPASVASAEQPASADARPADATGPDAATATATAVHGQVIAQPPPLPTASEKRPNAAATAPSGADPAPADAHAVPSGADPAPADAHAVPSGADPAPAGPAPADVSHAPWATGNTQPPAPAVQPTDVAPPQPVPARRGPRRLWLIAAAALVPLLGLLAVGGGALLWLLWPEETSTPDREGRVEADTSAARPTQQGEGRDQGASERAASADTPPQHPTGDKTGADTQGDAAGADTASDSASAARDRGTSDGSGRGEYVIEDKEIPERIENMAPHVRRRRASKLRHLAGRLTRGGAYAKAEKWYKRAWLLDPDSAQTAAGYARMLVAAGRKQEGLAWGRRALKLNPDSGRYHAAMGELFVELDKMDRAIEEYEKAAELAPRSRRIRSRLDHLRRARDRN